MQGAPYRFLLPGGGAQAVACPANSTTATPGRFQPDCVCLPGYLPRLVACGVYGVPGHERKPPTMTVRAEFFMSALWPVEVQHGVAPAVQVVPCPGALDGRLGSYTLYATYTAQSSHAVLLFYFSSFGSLGATSSSNSPCTGQAAAPAIERCGYSFAGPALSPVFPFRGSRPQRLRLHRLVCRNRAFTATFFPLRPQR